MFLDNFKQNLEINPAACWIAIITFIIVTLCFFISIFRKRFNIPAFLLMVIISVSAVIAPVGDILWVFSNGRKDISSLHFFCFYPADRWNNLELK